MMEFDYHHIEIPKEVREWINRLLSSNVRENTFINQERWLLGKTTAQVWEYAKSEPFWTCPLFVQAALTDCKLDCDKKRGSHECWEVFKKWAITPIGELKETE